MRQPHVPNASTRPAYSAENSEEPHISVFIEQRLSLGQREVGFVEPARQFNGLLEQLRDARDGSIEFGSRTPQVSERLLDARSELSWRTLELCYFCQRCLLVDQIFAIQGE